MFRRRAIWAVLTVLVLAAAAAAYHLMPPAAETRTQGADPPLAGDMAKFTLTQPRAPAPQLAFADAAGAPVDLMGMKGRVVLVNLWATWCAPCVAEMPSLDRLQSALGGPDFEVVALSLDRGGAAAVTPFYAKNGIGRLKAYLDPKGDSFRALKVNVLPTSLLFDRTGREVGRLVGDARWDGPEAQALIRHIMNEPAG